ncbi:MAG: rod shape-determining protein RodA [Deltaproteobacteria bacterium]|nr:rod shape-determining protein RodA [Deltaproteobacteria bacterium]
MKKQIEHVNWALIIIVSVLTVIGLINLYSALNVWGEAGNLKLVWFQMLWTVIGIIFLLILSFSDYRIFERLAYALYVISIIFIILPLFVGGTVAGHKSWLGIGGFGIQPSEFAKVLTLIVLAKYFSENPNPDGFGFVELIKPFVIAIIPAVIVTLQGDFGSALFFVLIFASLAWFAGIRKDVILIIAAFGILISVAGYHYFLSDYQKARITTFINPSFDVKGRGYHIAQSRIAVGSGKIFGKGYLKGNINKLKYLPEKHTDFVFPVLAEEWGFVGTCVTLLFYYALLAAAIEIAKQARDRFGTFIAVGIGSYFFWQITINIGGVLGLMPLTGVTLPLLSYGGSSTISVFASIGLLLGVSKKRFVF